MRAPGVKRQRLPARVRERARGEGRFPTHAEVRQAYKKAVPELQPALLNVKVKRTFYLTLKKTAEAEALTIGAWIRRQLRRAIQQRAHSH